MPKTPPLKDNEVSKQSFPLKPTIPPMITQPANVSELAAVRQRLAKLQQEYSQLYVVNSRWESISASLNQKIGCLIHQLQRSKHCLAQRDQLLHQKDAVIQSLQAELLKANSNTQLLQTENIDLRHRLQQTALQLEEQSQGPSYSFSAKKGRADRVSTLLRPLSPTYCTSLLSDSTMWAQPSQSSGCVNSVTPALTLQRQQHNQQQPSSSNSTNTTDTEHNPKVAWR